MGAMYIISVFLTFAVTYGRDIRAAPPTCFFCSNVADSVDCEATIQCSAGEKCFVDKILNDEGHIKFNLGCKSEHICDLIAQVGRRSLPEEFDDHVDKRSIVHLCTECCSAGYCNNAVCTGLTTPKPSIQCYNCPDVEAPHACEDVTVCDEDQECFADIWYNDRGDQRHSLGCRLKGQCGVYLHNATGALHGRDIGHGSIQLCGGCCDSNFCNLQGCHQIQMPKPRCKGNNSCRDLGGKNN